MNSILDLSSGHQTTVRRIMLLWEGSRNTKRALAPSLGLSFLFHALFFLLGGIAFIRPAQYGIELSQGGMEVYMVAALPKEMPEGVKAPAAEVLNNENHEMDMEAPKVSPAGTEENKSLLKSQNTRVSEDDKHFGDGSSPAPGLSRTTFYSAGGGSVDEKPGYLKNPAPPYPRESIQLGQEGVVLLSLTVDRTGRPRNVAIKQSSGFPLLDHSALKAVKSWKFSPGHIGFMSSDSELIIPIRFRLKDVERNTPQIAAEIR